MWESFLIKGLIKTRTLINSAFSFLNFFWLTYSSHVSEVGVFSPYTSFRFSPVEGLMSVNPSATVPSVITHLLLTWHTLFRLRWRLLMKRTGGIFIYNHLKPINWNMQRQHSIFMKTAWEKTSIHYWKCSFCTDVFNRPSFYWHGSWCCLDLPCRTWILTVFHPAGQTPPHHCWTLSVHPEAENNTNETIKYC